MDLNGDGYADLYPGDKLQMTDWHWFDWYNRPGVVFREGDAGCCAGNPGTAQAANKEEIMYKVISGDTTNLTDDEKLWFFHTPNPSTDAPEELNPHFDSLEGLEQTTFFQDGPPGLDCVYHLPWPRCQRRCYRWCPVPTLFLKTDTEPERWPPAAIAGEPH